MFLNQQQNIDTQVQLQPRKSTKSNQNIDNSIINATNKKISSSNKANESYNEKNIGINLNELLKSVHHNNANHSSLDLNPLIVFESSNNTMGTLSNMNESINGDVNDLDGHAIIVTDGHLNEVSHFDISNATIK
jgi:hypothetical protein